MGKIKINKLCEEIINIFEKININVGGFKGFDITWKYDSMI